MVKIELTNGDILRMNLKNREREETLRNAWYAMHDVPKWQSKVLKIISYTGNKYDLKVSEIKNCEYSDALFDYSTPEVERAVQPPRKLFENSVIPKEPVSVPELIKSVLDAAEEIFESIPEKYKENLFIFLSALRAADVPFAITDMESMQIASGAMREEDPNKIGEHVQKFIDHWRAQKK